MAMTPPDFNAILDRRIGQGKREVPEFKLVRREVASLQAEFAHGDSRHRTQCLDKANS
jgi:hypothetical protein